MKLFLLLLLLAMVLMFVMVQHLGRRMRASYGVAAACEKEEKGRYHCCSMSVVELVGFFVKQWVMIVCL